MDETRLEHLLHQLDNDPMERELDLLMCDIEIDMEAISQKAHQKLRKGQQKMKRTKKKTLAIVVASLVAVCTVTTVYASEISTFVQSLMSKTDVNGTVVEGQTYFLEQPVELNDGNRLTAAMFDDRGLQVRVEMADGSLPGAKIRVDGTEIEAFGMEGHNLFFDVRPTKEFELILGDQSYPVQLTASQSVVDGSEIIELESENVSWISLGYKKIKGGVQFLATTDDPSVEVVFFETPGKDTVKQTSSGNSGNSTREKFLPLIGNDKDGNAYEFSADKNDMGRPLTKYTSDAPAGTSLTMALPSIVVKVDDSPNLEVAIPVEKEKIEVMQTIDLGLQSMRLDSIERTSDTSAQLCFTLNTGAQENIRIWQAILDSPSSDSIQALWENGSCVVDVTFPSGTDELQLQISTPYLIVDGDWSWTVSS